MEGWEMYIGDSSGCCQLNEMYDLSGDAFTVKSVQQARSHKALFATTIQSQKQEVSVLKKVGFRAVAHWKSKETGNTITLWFCGPKRGR